MACLRDVSRGSLGADEIVRCFSGEIFLRSLRAILDNPLEGVDERDKEGVRRGGVLSLFHSYGASSSSVFTCACYGVCGGSVCTGIIGNGSDCGGVGSGLLGCGKGMVGCRGRGFLGRFVPCVKESQGSVGGEDIVGAHGLVDSAQGQDTSGGVCAEFGTDVAGDHVGGRDKGADASMGVGLLPVLCDENRIDRSERYDRCAGGEENRGWDDGMIRKKSDGGLDRGVNYVRNKKNREEKKKRKQRRRAMDRNWREVKSVDSSVKAGFFSECSRDIQGQLRESRAEMLIAENKRRAAEELIKHDRLKSPQTFVSEIIRVSAMADKLRKQTAEQKIGGWAGVVADSLTRSVASCAPSTVPSLESVGYGKSALRSSDGDSLDSERVRAYESSLKLVQDAFDMMDVHSEEDYENAIQRVKDDFADVAYTEAERERKDIIARVSFSMASSGIGYECIERVIASIS